MEILLFKLADETFGIPVKYVESIEHMLPVTCVPKSRQHIEGLVNIRGNIVPVIDITKLLNINKTVSKNVLILINYNKQSMSLAVDEVDDVIDADEGSVMSIAFGSGKISVLDYSNRIITYIGIEELNKI